MCNSSRSCSAVSSVPGMNSIPAAWQATAVRGQPSMVSWSVSARADRPWRWAWATNSSGEYVPSEKFVWRWRSANILDFKLIFDLPGGPQQFAPHFIENAVYKFPTVLCGKFFGNIHCFIDAHHRRNVVSMEHFVNRQTQNISIHRGNAVQLPIPRVPGNNGIGLVTVSERAP